MSFSEETLATLSLQGCTPAAGGSWQCPARRPSTRLRCPSSSAPSSTAGESTRDHRLDVSSEPKSTNFFRGPTAVIRLACYAGRFAVTGIPNGH